MPYMDLVGWDVKQPLSGTKCGKKIHWSHLYPSKIEWDLSNGPLSKLLGLLDAQVWGSVQRVLLEISWTIVSF